MTDEERLAELMARFEAEEGAPTRRAEVEAEYLARIFDAIGWKAAGGISVEEIAALAAPIMDAAGRGGDPDLAVHELARLMRSGMQAMDGSLPPISDFVPAAEEVMRRAGASVLRQRAAPSAADAASRR